MTCSHRRPSKQARQASEVGGNIGLELLRVVRRDHEGFQRTNVSDDSRVGRVRLHWIKRRLDELHQVWGEVGLGCSGIIE